MVIDVYTNLFYSDFVMYFIGDGEDRITAVNFFQKVINLLNYLEPFY